MAERPSPTLRASFLDRLIDLTPGKQVDPPKSPSQLLREIRESVRRDLEDLLNTRCVSPPRMFEQLEDSLVNYGLPDFAKFGNQQDLSELCHIIKTVIENFELRLTNITVQPLSEQDGVERHVRFRIDAALVDPASSPISFRSRLEPTTGTFSVNRGRQ